jgi:pimeloyl-ACP methyl ester carboxylesterase
MRVRQLSLSLVIVVLAAAPASASLELFDANVRYTAGIFLPLASYDASSIQPLTTTAWTAGARPISRVAADGVSLVLVRLVLPPTDAGAVRVAVVSDVPDADPGSVWAVQDQLVTDPTPLGGAIALAPDHRKHLTYVPTVFVGAQRFAFVLYRAPRNFDASTGATAAAASRTVRLVAEALAFEETRALTVVRPLVAFVHGTNADNDAWLRFPLWRDSANEVNGFAPGLLPFHATRISFNWIWNASGGVQENAATILPQLVTALRNWREATGTAATQADVVTHSFGGFIARQVAQTQPDPSPLSSVALHSFRAAENWGHGSIHKLITLGATHRGAATANATADVNQNGRVPGSLRALGCSQGSFIDKGALRDQMVLSDALGALGETRVPSHAVAGSGRAALDPSHFLGLGLTILALTDQSTGPYAQAAQAVPPCLTDSIANYVFNRDPDSPTITPGSTTETCDVVPNYDVVVSERSSLGLLPAAATTTAADLGLVKLLNHFALHDPASGSPEIVARVSDRIVFLLKQATTSAHFSPFPAVRSVPPSPVEEQLAKVSASGLEVGRPCPIPSSPPECPAYDGLQVVPSALRLEDTTPTPLNIYGLLETTPGAPEWTLAYNGGKCPVTFESHDPAVAVIATNEFTGAQTVVPVGPGVTTISVAVEGNGVVTVPLTVRLP